ncbi:MAG: GNAT family N-acetyltransferase [candidate division Zixibacteria bacterium]|nr:GNAT family N-acetyltransferase [candidate division Zixibacteria bacterium]
MVLVFSDGNSQPSSTDVLVGLFPIAARMSHEMLRVRTATLWRHTHSPLGTPLVRKGHERTALIGLLDWLDKERRLGLLLSIELAGGDGPFFEALQALAGEQKRRLFCYNEFSRGVFRPLADEEMYFKTVLSPKRRRNLRQEYDKLGKIGRLETLELKPGDDLEYWLKSFIALEASGWKGKLGTAIACSPIDMRFFDELSRCGFERGQLQMLMLRLDDRPIAMQYNLRSRRAVFALKIAYDEEFKRYSPGMLLGVEAFRLFHGRPDVDWVDSCPNAPVNIAREDLWNDSRLIRHVLVGTGNMMGQLLLRCLPTVRSLQRALRSLRKQGFNPAPRQ